MIMLTRGTHQQLQTTNRQPNEVKWTTDADDLSLLFCYSERRHQRKSSALSVQNWSAMMSSCKTVGTRRVLCSVPSSLSSGRLTMTEPCRRGSVLCGDSTNTGGSDRVMQTGMHLSKASWQMVIVDVEVSVQQLVFEVCLGALRQHAMHDNLVPDQV